MNDVHKKHCSASESVDESEDEWFIEYLKDIQSLAKRLC